MTLLNWILDAVALILTLGQTGVIISLYLEESRESPNEDSTLIPKLVGMMFLSFAACIIWIIELTFQLLAHGAGTPQFGWELLGLCVPILVLLFVILTH